VSYFCALAAAGAELRHLCDEAALCAARKARGASFTVTQQDFADVMMGIQAGLSEDILSQYQSWGQQFSR
jgi:ATP-dependent 26S proteasome regulatory subunit